jgi:5,10-methylene-tetrahydrofolate dehydrogenase/methenyl tetrahydrofolate cyclohydrolase
MKKAKLMVGVVTFLAVLLLGMKHANASVAYCLAEGYVELDYVSSDWIAGKIGNKEVGFAFYNGFIYGDVEGNDARLNVMRNNTVKGAVGPFQVQWFTDGKHIFGYQPCMLVVPEMP